MKHPKLIPRYFSSQSGTSLIEVLVSLVILMVALLGLTGLMVQSQNSQLESYQRVQALTLAQDMVSRINANGIAAYCYHLTPSALPNSYLGTNDGVSTFPTTCPATPVTVPVTATASAPQQALALQDLREWRSLLLGAAETDAGGSKIGSVLGARGCISQVAGQTNEYQVSVAWLGGSATYAPPAGIACGSGSYGTDTQRRAVSLTLHITPP